MQASDEWNSGKINVVSNLARRWRTSLRRELQMIVIGYRSPHPTRRRSDSVWEALLKPEGFTDLNSTQAEKQFTSTWLFVSRLQVSNFQPRCGAAAVEPTDNCPKMRAADDRSTLLIRQSINHSSQWVSNAKNRRPFRPAPFSASRCSHDSSPIVWHGPRHHNTICCMCASSQRVAVVTSASTTSTD